MRAVLILAFGLLVACGVQPEYVCSPQNCGGCCQENQCVGVTGGCGTEPGADAGTDAGSFDAGIKMDGGSAGTDAGVLNVTMTYDFGKPGMAGCSSDTLTTCQRSKQMSASRFNSLVSSDYPNCVFSSTATAGTIDCTGKCMINTYSCTGGGTYDDVQCLPVEWTLGYECSWDPPIF